MRLFALSALSLLLLGCGDSGDAGDSRGPFTFAIGGGQGGSELDDWNALHPDERVSMIQLPDEADLQLDQIEAALAAKDDSYAVLSLDIIWTGELASRGWLLPLDEQDMDTAAMFPSTVDSGRYQGTFYAVPASTDTGLFYYRTDLLAQAGISGPPRTWAELRSDCDAVRATTTIDCYAGQLAHYEGLTVNFVEAVHSAGDNVLSADGRQVALGPGAVSGLGFLVDSLQGGYLPADALQFYEEDGRIAFQHGELVFLRNWPYANWFFDCADCTDEQGNPDPSTVIGKWGVAPMPGLDGPGSGVLGGHNLAISAYTKHPASARDFVKFMTDRERQRQALQEAAFSPTRPDLYDDSALIADYPYLPMLKQALLAARARPTVARYADFSTAIQDEAYAALGGDKTAEQAIDDLRTRLQAFVGPP